MVINNKKRSTYFREVQIADYGLQITDLGLRIADCGLRIAD
jgi:hypothetical protein